MQQVHRQARAHLETGGIAVPASKDAKKPPARIEDFLLPKDVDAEEVMAAIEAKLRGGRGSQESESKLLERKAGGRVVVPAAHLLRLGDGNFAKGRRFLHGLVWAIRRQRMRRK
jgi:hypothetical protein